MERTQILELMILFLLICSAVLACYCFYLEQKQSKITNECNKFWKEKMDKECIGGYNEIKNIESTQGMGIIGAIPTI